MVFPASLFQVLQRRGPRTLAYFCWPMRYIAELPSHPCTLPPSPPIRPQQGTAATHPFAHLSLLKWLITASLQGYGQYHREDTTALFQRKWNAHPRTQHKPAIVLAPRFIRCYKNNRAVKISEPMCGGCSRRGALARHCAKSSLHKEMNLARQKFKAMDHLKTDVSPIYCSAFCQFRLRKHFAV